MYNPQKSRRAAMCPYKINIETAIEGLLTTRER